MGPAQAVSRCLRRYVTFSGRASRSEYWWFILVTMLTGAVLGAVDHSIFGPGATQVAGMSIDGPIASVFGLAMLPPQIAAGWRRMHDTGRSGLYLLYPIIVTIGIMTFMATVAGFGPLLSGDFGALVSGGVGIVMLLSMIVLLISPLLVLWWLTRPSEPGPNSYGPNPHEVRP